MTTNILVPDIGGFSNVSIIEILVKEGDEIKKDQAILVLESDKATIEVPSNNNGVITKLLLKVGDKVSQGSLIAIIEIAKEKDLKNIEAPVAPTTNALTSTNINTSSDNTYDYDVIVIGAGPAGYSAAFRCADLGQKVAIIERYKTLGGVCLNVGCIPSKALLHMALILDEAQNMSQHGINFSAPQIDINKIREHKNTVINKLTSGLSAMAKIRKVQVITGSAKFKDPHTISIENIDSKETAVANSRITFKQAIIAVGSSPVNLPFLPTDPRIVNSTGALELPFIPKKMLIIGGGIIGLEMATVYIALGSAIDVVEMSNNLMAGADTDLVKVWQKYNKDKFNKIMLETKTISAKALDQGIQIEFEDKYGTITTDLYDLVLVSVGRTPNGNSINADNIGINVDDKGFIAVNNQQQTNIEHIYAIGDVVGQPMLAHKGVHEGHIAAENASGHKAYFDAVQIPSVAYTNPEVAWAGLTENSCKKQGIDYKTAVFPWQASGRAIANARDEGFTKLIFEPHTKRIIGGAIVGTNAGDLIGEIALAIEMGADSIDIAKTIHPHPTLCESIGMSAEVFNESCTDLPPVKKI